MKHIIPFVLLFLSILWRTVFTQTGWVLQNPVEDFLYLNQICPVDSQLVFVLADSGNILKTVNAGLTWSKKMNVGGIRWNLKYGIFEDQNRGLVLSDFGQSISTIDGAN